MFGGDEMATVYFGNRVIVINRTLLQLYRQGGGGKGLKGLGEG